MNRVFRNVPDSTIRPGRSQSPSPSRFSVNWYGWTIPTEGNSRSVKAIPAFEGLSTWRVDGPTRTRKIALEATAATVAKMIGPCRSLA